MSTCKIANDYINLLCEMLCVDKYNICIKCIKNIDINC
nr:MAG TPA: hypothetical protein [Caudoviricetes sp.]